MIDTTYSLFTIVTIMGTILLSMQIVLDYKIFSNKIIRNIFYYLVILCAILNLLFFIKNKKYETSEE